MIVTNVVSYDTLPSPGSPRLLRLTLSGCSATLAPPDLTPRLLFGAQRGKERASGRPANTQRQRSQ